MICVFDNGQRAHAPSHFIVAGRPQPIPERPERIDMLLSGVARLGLPVQAPEPQPLSALTTVHTPRYLDFHSTLLERWRHIPNASDYPAPNVYAMGRPGLAPVTYPDGVVGQVGWHMGDGSCPMMDQTLPAALASAATALHGAGLLLAGESQVYALCRPPGHHASSDMAAGFCYFNNSALAAEALTRAGKRTAILDIDVHHGNGTEAIFYDRPDVLTVSLHCDPRRFYPFFWGHADERGAGEGEGFNLNLPLPRGTGITAYRAALDQALRRIGDFNPHVLVVATGLDTAVDDPFQAFTIVTPEFAEIGRAIAALKLPTLWVQEGGYPSASLGPNLASLLSGALA